MRANKDVTGLLIDSNSGVVHFVATNAVLNTQPLTCTNPLAVWGTELNVGDGAVANEFINNYKLRSRKFVQEYLEVFGYLSRSSKNKNHRLAFQQVPEFQNKFPIESIYAEILRILPNISDYETSILKLKQLYATTSKPHHHQLLSKVSALPLTEGPIEPILEAMVAFYFIDLNELQPSDELVTVINSLYD